MDIDNRLFARRYQISSELSKDWDEGRGGEVLAAYDKHNEDKVVVIKRVKPRSTEILTIQRNVKKEAQVLKLLKGRHVPKWIDEGIGNCNGDNCYYFVMEKAQGLRVESNMEILSLVERIKILHQLLSLLFFAHYELFISNGDVDLKHLFWHRSNQNLTVIDWGNARKAANQHDKSIDYARTAEIILQIMGPDSHLDKVTDSVISDRNGLPKEIIFEKRSIVTPPFIGEVVDWGIPRANRGDNANIFL